MYERESKLLESEVSKATAKAAGLRMPDAETVVRVELRHRFKELEFENAIPPDFVRWEVFANDSNPRTLRVALARNYARYPMTEAEFEEMVGRKPREDDLDRINCPDAGEMLHTLCGWNLRHWCPAWEAPPSSMDEVRRGR